MARIVVAVLADDDVAVAAVAFRSRQQYFVAAEHMPVDAKSADAKVFVSSQTRS